MTASNILVLGATGTVASNVVAGLKDKGVAVKAGSRTGGKDADSVAFDYADPATFDPALKDVSAVFVLVPGGVTDAYEFAAPFVTFATKQKVKVVLMTAMGVNAAPESPYARLEKLLTSSGAP